MVQFLLGLGTFRKPVYPGSVAVQFFEVKFSTCTVKPGRYIAEALRYTGVIMQGTPLYPVYTRHYGAEFAIRPPVSHFIWSGVQR